MHIRNCDGQTASYILYTFTTGLTAAFQSSMYLIWSYTYKRGNHISLFISENQEQLLPLKLFRVDPSIVVLQVYKPSEVRIPRNQRVQQITWQFVQKGYPLSSCILYCFLSSIPSLQRVISSHGFQPPSMCRYSLVGIQEPSVVSQGQEPDRVAIELCRFDQELYQRRSNSKLPGPEGLGIVSDGPSKASCLCLGRRTRRCRCRKGCSSTADLGCAVSVADLFGGFCTARCKPAGSELCYVSASFSLCLLQLQRQWRRSRERVQSRPHKEVWPRLTLRPSVGFLTVSAMCW